MRGTVFQLVGDSNHYWVVVAEKGGKVLAFNVTDARHCPDSPCLLHNGEHVILTKESAVSYRRAKEFDAATLRKEIAKRQAVRTMPSFPETLLNRMIEGAFMADDITVRLLTYLK